MRRLIVTLVATLCCLGFEPSALAAQDATPIAAGEALDPALCRVAPRTAEELLALWTDESGDVATPAADDDWTTDVILTAVPVPLGEPAGADLVAAITAAVRETYACINAEDNGRFFALVSDAMVSRLFGPDDDVTLESVRSLIAPGEPLAEPDQTRLIAVTDVAVMEDGRVAALVIGDDPAEPPEGPESALLIFVEERGHWVVDGVLEFTVDDEQSGSAGTDSADAGATPAGALPSVTGSSYQSPTYGYAVTWDADWTVVRSTSDEGQDQLVLSQGPIRATFHGVPAGDGTTLPTDPDDCLEAIVERVATDPAIANFGPAPAELGGPIGDDAGAAAGSYVSEVTSQSGNTGEVVYFISCRKLSPTAALITTYTALRSQAEVAVPLFRALDANFVLSGDATPAP